MDRALEMQVFCTVVDKGSFVGAAEPLGMSKAAISRYVNALEERLGHACSIERRGASH